MAFLRSGKFFRFLSAGKNLVNFREYEVATPSPAICVCSSKNFATANQQIATPSQSLENSIRRLDQDVKRSGRISRRDLEEILEEIQTSKAATSSQSLLVIRCCGNLVPEELPEVRTKIVQDIWKTLTKLQVPMDISHYNALLRVYLENEYNFSPTEFLSDLQSKGVEPNRVTFQRLIARYCQQGDIDGATRILEFMREKQLPVNENVFNALIMGHSNADDMESAVGILSVMTQAGLEPSADTYTALLCGFAKTGDTEAIEKFIQLGEKKEIFLLDSDLLEIVYSLAINGHGSKVNVLLAHLKKSVGYNQDAINVILKLINKGQENVAMEILGTMIRRESPNGEQTDTGNFLIRQLIKADRPIEQVMSICKKLESENANSKPLMIALETGLASGKPIALEILRELKAQNVEIRQHYFWPLLAKARNEEEVHNILNTMKNEFSVQPTSETIREYAAPKLMRFSQGDHKKVISGLMGLCSMATATSCVAYQVLTKNNIKLAAELMNSVESYYSVGLYKHQLLNALNRTKDFESYVSCVRAIHDNMERSKLIGSRMTQEEEQEDEESHEMPIEETGKRSNKELQSEVAGEFLLSSVIYFKKERVEFSMKLMQGFVDHGMSISSAKAERIQDKIGEQMTNEISTLLGKLTSGELELVQFEKKKLGINARQQSTLNVNEIESLEKAIRQIEGRGDNAKNLKRLLLIAAIKTRDVEKTEGIYKKLEAEGFTFGAGVYAQLVDMYASLDKIDESLVNLKKLKELDSEFKLDNSKILKVAQAYINLDRFDDALKFLDEQKHAEVVNNNSFNFRTQCWNLLNSLAEKGDSEKVEKLFSALVNGKYIVPNNVLLGPIIKSYIVNDKIDLAVQKFEEICTKYRATPWKNEIACRLIQAEDATSLQKITDLSTEIHGEVNSLYDLVFSFLECGRIRQARKILETPGLHTRTDRFNYACERFVNENQSTALEGMIEATRDLNYIDRAEIFNSLLSTYIKEDSAEKALGLWTKMQEDDIQPKDEFLIRLAEFLKSKGAEVPFVVPKVSQKAVEVKEVKKVTKAQPENEKEKENSPYSNYRKALKSQDCDEIIKTKSKLSEKQSTNVIDKSHEVEAFLRGGRLELATKVVFEMLESNSYPMARVFKFYANKISTNGDYQTLEKMRDKIDDELKKNISFDNKVCHAYVVAGKAEEYMKKLENVIDNAKTPEDIAKAGEKFPRGGAIGLIETHPELIGRMEEIAEKYAEKNIVGPINVIWMHHFLAEDTKADEIFKKHLKDSPRLMFTKVLESCRDNKDEKTLRRLLAVLREAKVSEGAVGFAWSSVIDILAGKNEGQLVLNTISESIKDVSLENLNRTSLLKAKSCVESAGLKFPHQIPEKTKSKKDESSSSSSSSSSDDEVTRKKQ